jgi:phosphatidylglycerophosphate synthase
MRISSSTEAELVVMEKNYYLTLPNAISASRLLLSPVLLLLAWNGCPTAFIVVAVVAFLLDALDGPVARLMHQVTELGPRLDTWADLTIYFVLPVCLWWLWPDLVRRELPYIVLILASLVCPGIAGLVKFRGLTSYHTWLVKGAVLVTSLSTLVLILQGPALPFHLASLLSLAAGLEQVLITLVLNRPRSDVRSLFHVLREKSRGE